MNNILGRIAGTLLIMVTIAAMLGIFATTAPWIDEKMFPVLSDSQIVDKMKNADGTWNFRYKFYKHRDCQLLRTYWFFIDPSGTVGEADVTKNGGTIGRPSGWNLSIWWKLGRGESVPGRYLLRLDYDCGLFWTTRAIQGPFLIDGKELKS